MQYLYGRGITDETIEYFGLGLTTPYRKGDKFPESSDALRAPLINAEGIRVKRAVYYNISGVSINSVDKNGWCKGEPAFCYSQKREKQPFLFVCEGLKDLWLLHQKLRQSRHLKDILLISSTHGSGLPKEVESTHLLNGFDKVFCGHDNDDAGHKMAKRFAKHAGLKARRVCVPEDQGKDWTDYFNKGNSIEDFFDLLKGAKEYDRNVIEAARPLSADQYLPGPTYEYKPVEISGVAYSNGYQYYTVQTHHVELQQRSVDGCVVPIKVHGKRVLVIRSDKQLLTFRKLPQLRGDDVLSSAIYILEDDTIIEGKPQISRYATWQWNSINRWLKGKLVPRHISNIIKDILAYFRSQFWLPNNDDYIMLALSTVVTHTQEIFKSVPLLLATGQPGSGKSTIGASMTNLCANARIIGQTSPASMARMISESRGFVVLDDLEAIAREGSRDCAFNELEQALKVSYNKATAIKYITDMRFGEAKVRCLNFYGVKLINNTRGVERIVGTRTLKIYTQKAPKGRFTIREVFSPIELQSLRNELHCWSFENTETIAQTYKRFPTEDRIDEITAPLRTIAGLSRENEKYQAVIDLVVECSHNEDFYSDEPEEILKQAVFNLVSIGFESVSIEHVILEMKTLVPENYKKSYTTDIPEWQTNIWVKRQMVQMGWIVSGSEKRTRINRTSKAIRIYKFLPRLFNDFQTFQPDTEPASPIKGEEFCRFFKACPDCPYDYVNCEFKNTK